MADKTTRIVVVVPKLPEVARRGIFAHPRPDPENPGEQTATLYKVGQTSARVTDAELAELSVLETNGHLYVVNIDAQIEQATAPAAHAPARK
jgi:hypothetical protein